MALINTTTTGVLGTTVFADGSGDLTIQQNGAFVNKITSNGLTNRGTGSVLQVATSTLSTHFSTTSIAYVYTGLSVSITPTSASSKILLLQIVHDCCWWCCNVLSTC
jgi:preprotein translocase subunit SecG